MLTGNFLSALTGTGYKMRAGFLFSAVLQISALLAMAIPCSSAAAATRYRNAPGRHAASFRFADNHFGGGVILHYPVRGIDISKYQLKINWAMISKRTPGTPVHFVFIKATDGVSGLDNRFLYNWKKARAAGIVRGAYHYFYPTLDPLLQARNFERTVHLHRGDLPPVLDIEWAGNLSDAAVRSAAKRWLNEIQRRYHVRPIIYTNIGFYKRYLSAGFDRYPLWIPGYAGKRPDPGKQWMFWQCSNSRRINGISTAVDYNVFNGSRSDFKKLLIP